MYLALCEINNTFNKLNRDVAQFGSALPWGGRGRRFKSCRSDFFIAKIDFKLAQSRKFCIIQILFRKIFDESF